MKIRSLAILSMVAIGLSCTHADEPGEGSEEESGEMHHMMGGGVGGMGMMGGGMGGGMMGPHRMMGWGGMMMGPHHMMIEHLFGDKDKISKEDFVKHFEKKFDAIDEGKTGEITKDQAVKYFDEKWKKKMQEKFCGK